MSDEIARQIEADIQAFDAHSSWTSDLRRKVITKLGATVDELSLDAANMKASELESRVGLISVYLKALDDSDKQRIDAIKLKQRIKADETANGAVKEVSAMVAEFLRRTDLSISITKPAEPVAPAEQKVVDDEIDKLFESAADEAGVVVLDSELEFSTAEVKDIKN